MKVAGVKEVKDRLSHFLRLVAEGEVVLVTDRGTVVAQLGPPPVSLPWADDGERAALERLARLGLVRLRTAGALPSAGAPLPPAVDCDVSELLAETRADL